MEQLYSPLVVLSRPEQGELKSIGLKCITRHHSHHDLGFAETQWRLFMKEDPPRIKPLLYVYRVLLTGINLMKSGKVEAHLPTLNETFHLPYVSDLIALKTASVEQATLNTGVVEYYAQEYRRLVAELEESAAGSNLRDEPDARECPIFERVFAWFEKFGWKKGWEWGEPPTFGGVCSGECEIFLCENGQGGRGRSTVKTTFGPEGNTTGDKGVWMSIWVDDVDGEYQRCVAQGLEIAWPPTDEAWGVREMHVRHPDGHVFRVSQSISKET